MSIYNYLILNMTCPRCGTNGEVEAEFRFGLRELIRYQLGDRLQWEGLGVKTPSRRPDGGNFTGEAYAVCPTCKRDYWLIVSVREDVITCASVDETRRPYLSDES